MPACGKVSGASGVPSRSSVSTARMRLRSVQWPFITAVETWVAPFEATRHISTFARNSSSSLFLRVCRGPSQQKGTSPRCPFSLDAKMPVVGSRWAGQKAGFLSGSGNKGGDRDVSRWSGVGSTNFLSLESREQCIVSFGEFREVLAGRAHTDCRLSVARFKLVTETKSKRRDVATANKKSLPHPSISIVFSLVRSSVRTASWAALLGGRNVAVFGFGGRNCRDRWSIPRYYAKLSWPTVAQTTRTAPALPHRNILTILLPCLSLPRFHVCTLRITLGTYGCPCQKSFLTAFECQELPRQGVAILSGELVAKTKCQ